MKHLFIIPFFLISFFTFGQNSSNSSIQISDVPHDSLPKFIIKMGKTTYPLDTVPDSINPNWIKKFEVLKSKELRNIYGNGNGIILMYPYKRYFKQIRSLLDTTLNNQKQITKQTLDSIYIKALNNQFDLLLSSGQKFIEPNEQTERIKNSFDHNSVYKFLSSKELFNYTYKHGKTLKLYRIMHKQISNDTIDIQFGNLTLTVKKGFSIKNGLHFRKANYVLDSDVTNRYIPDFRFVYNKEEKTWNIVDGKHKLSN